MGEQFFDPTPTAEDLWFPECATDTQQLFYKSVAQFCEDTMGPAEERIANKDYPLARELFRGCAELGVFAAELDEADDGLGFGVLDATLLSEAMGRGHSLNVGFMVHQGVGMLPVACFGNDEQRAHYLPRAAAGECIMAFALTEPHCGSDALALTTSATLQGESYIINGAKQFITNAGYADCFVTFARIPDVGITAFLVDRDSPGLSIGPEEKKLGQHASSTCSVMYENVAVAKSAILGTPGKGHKIALNMLNLGRLKLAAASVGKMKVLLPQAVAYVKERTAFGQPIAGFGMLRDRLARMASLLFAVESTVYRVASVMDQALSTAQADTSVLGGTERLTLLKGFALECALVKSFASESRGVFSDDMLQLYGGYGFSEEYPAAKAFREARVTRLYEGTTEICRLTLMQRLLAQCEGIAETAPKESQLGVSAQKAYFGSILKELLAANGGDVRQMLGRQDFTGPLAAAFERIYAAESVLLRSGEGASVQRDLAEFYVAMSTSENLACAHGVSGLLASNASLLSMDSQKVFPTTNSVLLRERVVESLLENDGNIGLNMM